MTTSLLIRFSGALLMLGALSSPLNAPPAVAAAPVEEITWLTAVQWLARVGSIPEVLPAANTRNLYHFLFNDNLNLTDELGMQPNALSPKEGDTCSCNTCKITAKFERVSVNPTLTGGGCTREKATSWTITVKVSYNASGDCVI